MSSNLLAHHVDVLIEAGVVRRIRSEGDRRRSYLSLVFGAFDELLPATRTTATRVVFVCTENAARSQLAAALWASHSDIPVASAGTHPARCIHPKAMAAARRQHLCLPTSKPTHLGEVIREGDTVITVCDRAHEELPEHTVRAHWSVADPVRSGIDEAFDAAFDELARRISRIAPVVVSHQPDPTDPDALQSPSRRRHR
jgi:protein-tyrosine-phosphatase